MVTFVRDRVEKDQDKLIKLERKINPLLGGYSNILLLICFSIFIRIRSRDFFTVEILLELMNHFSLEFLLKL